MPTKTKNDQNPTIKTDNPNRPIEDTDIEIIFKMSAIDMFKKLYNKMENLS